ncbi:aldose 1-epimerase [Brucella sp. BE17]|uniref:aldose 1-epimerase n=1 Tax=Brucella sp. BE17 TaxID=3142977 RepID=UPI0031BA8A79
MALCISSKRLSASISNQGGVVLGLWWLHEDGTQIPLLRPAAHDNVAAMDSAAFPMVPFANRLGGNGFAFRDRIYHLSANTSLDPLYLHGDGWLAQWDTVEHLQHSLVLSYRHPGDGKSPYNYTARQVFNLDEHGLNLQMSVTNEGADELPFGLGWHPYFPLRSDTLIKFEAKKFYTEAEGCLPGEELKLSEPFDFRAPRSLPQRWINNGFSDFQGTAYVYWPVAGLTLEMHCDPAFAHVFLYLPYIENSKASMPDFFCLEPMTHRTNGHNSPDLGNLRSLAPGEVLSGSIRLTISASPTVEN